MNEKEIMELIEALKKDFKREYPKKNEEEIEHMILDRFFKGFCYGKMSRADLTTLTRAMGYDIKEEVLDQIEREMKGGK